MSLRVSLRALTTHLGLAACAGLMTGTLVVASSTPVSGPSTTDTVTLVVDPIDPEVVLPSRVDAALRRTLASIDRATAAIDDRQADAALLALKATKQNLSRSYLAVQRQVEAPVDEESESTAGPDSVLAGLNVGQVVITRVAGLFDRITAAKLCNALKGTLNVGLDQRATLLTLVLALKGEKGASYADVLVDTVPNYTDEVANLQEALRDDHLTAANRATLQAALKKSKAAEAAMLKAFPVED